MPIAPVVGVRVRAAVGCITTCADRRAHAGCGFFWGVLLCECIIDFLASRTGFLFDVIDLINFIVNDCICVVVRVLVAIVSLAILSVGRRLAGCGFGFGVGIVISCIL